MNKFDKWVYAYHCFMAMMVVFSIIKALWGSCWIYVLLNLFIWTNTALVLERIKEKKRARHK